MKKHSINFVGILSYFRHWLNRKGIPPRQHTRVSPDPVTNAQEVLHLCCGLVRQTETYVRRQTKRLNPYLIKKVTEPDSPICGYKGLQIESKDYALWCEFFNRSGKPRREKERLYCQVVLLYFHDHDRLDGFLNALKDEEDYQYFWDYCWLDLGEPYVKITLELGRTSEHPHCFRFQAWNEKLIDK